ncbi:MAG: ATP-binding cassette domain-containing protein, partial [Trueperaceae bacterium]
MADVRNVTVESDTIISARNLSRSYRLPDRREGLRGSLVDLLRPRYRHVQAVSGIDLDIARGESVAYIGPNGAGKSTTVKMLAGILKPTSGELRVLGLEPHRERERYVRNIGVVFGQRTSLWWDIAVIESLRLLQRVYDVPEAAFRRRLERFDEVLGIGAFLRTPARKLSLGQRVMADLAAALLHDPPVVFLDEPTIGIDVSVKARIREFLRDANRSRGTTLLLTTHDLGDVEALSNRVIVIDRGSLAFDGTSEALRQELGSGSRIVVRIAESALPDLETATLPFGVTWQQEGRGRYAARYDAERVSTPELVARILASVSLEDLELRGASMEDVVR